MAATGEMPVLELRIHGVNNTPPAEMLYAVSRYYGDDLIGVYEERPERGNVKAFSWGSLSRTSLPANHFGGLIEAISRVAWIAVMPFGVVNFAYWSRRLILPGESYGRARLSAAMVRIFGLGLTLLLVSSVSSVCSVSLDMLESRLEPGVATPSWLACLTGVEPGRRMAMFSLLPLMAVLALWLLSAVTRSRYDRGSSLPGSLAPMSASSPAGHLPSWSGCPRNGGNLTAAGMALTLVWTGQFWFSGHRCVAWAVIAFAIMVVVICLALIAMMPLASEDRGIGPGRRCLANAILGVSGVVFAIQTVSLFFGHSDSHTRHLAGLRVFPVVIAVLLLVTAVSALGWRAHENHPGAIAVPGCFTLAAVVYLIVSYRSDRWLVDAIFLGVLAVVALAWVWRTYWSRQKEPAAELWYGTGPGVALLLSLFSAMLLSTVFVMVAAVVLGDRQWVTPAPIYLSFATMLGPAVCVFGAVLVVVFVRVRCAGQTLEKYLEPGTQPSESRIADLAPDYAKAHPGGWRRTLLRLGRPQALQDKRSKVRKTAAFAYRAEPLLAALALIAGIALVLGLALTFLGYRHDLVHWDQRMHCLRTFGLTLVLLLGLMIVALCLHPRGRPLGVVWDLICFLPRAAHPFGPPCYAQRAVPELLDFCRAWLGDTAADPKAQRRLILSAHSLGGVLAVAVVLMLAELHEGRVALVTYGSQLRGYCSRMFPELLGPQVLGIIPTRPPRLFRSHTYADEPAQASAEGPLRSLRDVLSVDGEVRWINLWRSTDYLGFPVYSRRPQDNPIDRPADEVTAEVAQEGAIDPDSSPPKFLSRRTVRVDAHADYFRADQYQAAISELAAQLTTNVEDPSGDRDPGPVARARQS